MSSTPKSVSATRSLAEALTEQRRTTLDICYIKRDYALYHVILHDFDSVQRKRKAVPTYGWTMQRLVEWDLQTAQLKDDREGWVMYLMAARNEWKGHMDKYKDVAKNVSWYDGDSCRAVLMCC